MAGIIHSIAISQERGQLKNEVLEAEIVVGLGIVGDGHSGDWSRQITCLDFNSLLKSNRENNLKMGPGDFAENILLEGINCNELTVGSQLKIGLSVIIEVSQIGKEDHPSIVSKTFGVSLLPSEGLFCKVINGGIIKKGDNVEVVQ